MERKANIPVTILFLLYPLGALPFILIEIYNRKKYAVYLFAFFMAFLAYLLIPTTLDDLGRHYSDYENLKGFNWTAFKQMIVLNADFVLPTFQFILSQLGLSKQFIPFISVFIGYLVKLLILFNFFILLKKTEDIKIDKKTTVILILIAIFSVSFRNFALNIRMPVSLSFLTLGVFNLFFQNKKSGWIFVILATITHYMTIIIIPLILLANVLSNTKILRKIFLVSFLFFFLPPSFITESIQTVSISNTELQKRQTEYTEGYWAQEFMNNLSFKGRVSRQLGNSAIYFILFYLVVFVQKSKLRNLLYLLAIVTNFLFSMPMLFSRYGYALGFLFFLLVLYELKDWSISPKGRLLIKIYLFFTITTWLSMVYSTRLQIIKSHPQMLYQTTYSILNNDITPDDYIPVSY